MSSNTATYTPCYTCGDVYFDNMTIRFTEGRLREECHYYPYGLPMAGLGEAKPGFKENRRRYQGNEYNQELGLNWMNFHNRQYDPQLGRFLIPDPLADWGGQERVSVYAGMGNNPAMEVDPLGLSPLNMEHYDAGSPVSPVWGGNGGVDHTPGEANQEFVDETREYFSEKARERAKQKEEDHEEATTGNESASGAANTGNNDLTGPQSGDGDGKKKVEMKSADEYNYLQEEIPGKKEDDWNYIKNGEDGNMVTRWWNTVKRDWNAKDNVAARDIGELVEFGVNVLPVRLLRAGPKKLTQYETVIDVSKFTKRVRGSGSMADPKSGYYLSPTQGNPHGNDAVYKLFDSKGNRIGTFDSNGKYLRP